MKRIAWMLTLLASCAPSQTAPPSDAGQNETDFETQLASILQYDPALLKTGEFVVYFVKRQGDTQSQTYRWAAVGEEGSNLWIESRVPFGMRPIVVKSKIDRTGKLLEQWAGEPGGKPGQTYPSPRGKSDLPPVRRDSSAATPEMKQEPDQIMVGGRPYPCTRITTTLTYPDGRKSKMVNWFSKEVPFAASKQLGGLLKRQFGRLTMEFAAGDTKGARSELTLPPK